MEVQVRAHSIQLKDDDRQYAERKIGKAVQKILGGGGTKVDVEVSNLDHGKGAPLSRVKVNVHVPHAKSVSISVDDPEVRAAVDLAADKIWRAVKRLRQKRRDTGRQAEPMPIGIDDDAAAQTFSGEEDPAAISAERLPIAPLPA